MEYTVIDFPLKAFGEGRIWRGCLPDILTKPVAVLAENVPAENRIGDLELSIALEVCVPHGARIVYALIGGVLRSGLTEELKIKVELNSNNERIYTDSLLKITDEVRIGLPREYGDAVLNGIADVQRDCKIMPAGELLVCRAAHGAIGSSPSFFGHVAMAFAKIISPKYVGLTNDELVEALQKII